MEIVPRPKEKPARIITFLFYFSLIILILTVGGFFGLNIIGNKKNQELNSLKETLIQKETSKELVQLQSELSTYKEKIDTISYLLNSYYLGTNFFKFIEGYTHPQVKWDKADVDILSSKISLSGQTSNFTTLIQQLYIFENNSQIKDLELTNFSFLKDKKIVDFSLNFSISPSLFKLQ